MSEMIIITQVEPMEGHWIRATFSDGAIKEIDMSELLAGGGVFAPIREQREVFEQVRVNPETHTVEWPDGVDLDPEVLYGRFEPASGIRIRRRTVRKPAFAASSS
jgi:Protein of unknown function (DUF2442)